MRLDLVVDHISAGYVSPGLQPERSTFLHIDNGPSLRDRHRVRSTLRFTSWLLFFNVGSAIPFAKFANRSDLSILIVADSPLLIPHLAALRLSRLTGSGVGSLTEVRLLSALDGGS